MNRRINKFILYILCIAVIILLGCSKYISLGKQATDETEKVDGFKKTTYHNTDWGFSLDIPKSWVNSYEIVENDETIMGEKGIICYFRGESKASKEYLLDLFAISDLPEDRENLLIDSVKKIGNIKGNHIYSYYPGTDSSLGLLEPNEGDSEKEKKLKEKDFKKMKEMKEQVDMVLKSFKVTKSEGYMIKEENKYKTYEDCIFNESSIKLLTNEDIVGYDKVLLQKGINEIYARHGYIFNKDEWKEYFSKKEWYEENEKFSMENLNEIEKQNIMFLKGSECIKSKGDLNFDVDLDGEKEVLDFSIENIRKNAEKTYVDFQYNDSYYGALITDIDINDKQQEILIFDGGPSGDDTIGLYRYDEERNKFTYINSSTARHYDYSINGNGYIKLEGDRHGIYVINIYKLIEEHLEYVNTEYHQYTISKDIGQIPKGTKVTIIGFDYKDDQKYTGTEGIDHGPNGLLGIKITPVSDKSTIEVIDLSLYDTIRRRNDDTRGIVPFDVLMDIFDEIGNMYYGD